MNFERGRKKNYGNSHNGKKTCSCIRNKFYQLVCFNLDKFNCLPPTTHCFFCLIPLCSNNTASKFHRRQAVTLSFLFRILQTFDWKIKLGLYHFGWIFPLNRNSKMQVFLIFFLSNIINLQRPFKLEKFLNFLVDKVRKKKRRTIKPNKMSSSSKWCKANTRMPKIISKRAGGYSDCILGIDSGRKHREDGSKCASCASSGVDVCDCYAAVDGSDDNKDECTVDKNVCSYLEAVANSDVVKCDLESSFRLWKPSLLFAKNKTFFCES